VHEWDVGARAAGHCDNYSQEVGSNKIDRNALATLAGNWKGLQWADGVLNLFW
jgi:hypothetical protein